MPASQRKSQYKSQPARTADFIAAVRYLDGSREIFHVLKADDLADARAMVLAEVGDVRSLLLTPKH